MQRPVANIIASSIALLVLVAMVTAGVAASQPGEHFLLYEIFGCLFTIPLALAMWNGAMWKHGDKPMEGPSHWRQWLHLSLASAGISAVFLAIDLLILQGHAGISAVFTVGAIAMTVVALPSALRAWILNRLKVDSGEGSSDA